MTVACKENPAGDTGKHMPPTRRHLKRAVEHKATNFPEKGLPRGAPPRFAHVPSAREWGKREIFASSYLISDEPPPFPPDINNRFNFCVEENLTPF
ncbi:hypothetical protein ACEPPN_016969 [Leptodophora sp. 'Broadleaf-Isolate-01']